VFFGLLYLNLILMFLETRVHAKLVAPAAVFLGYLVLVRLGWLPTVTFY
jgi:ABC-type enterochelin transport system permease subunit